MPIRRQQPQIDYTGLNILLLCRQQAATFEGTQLLAESPKTRPVASHLHDVLEYPAVLW